MRSLNRPLVAFLHDIVMAAISVHLSLYMRLGSDYLAVTAPNVWISTGLFVVTAAAVFRMTGLYRGIWRYASMNDLVAIIKAVSLVSAALVITFICWYVAYPAILRKGNVWPVTLFGVVTGVAWCSIWLLGLYLFWDKLTISPDDIMKRHGLRILVAAIATVFAFAWTRIWRSKEQKT